MYSKIKLKIGSHCSNAVVSNHGNIVFSDRFVYKTGFIKTELFDPKYVARLLSVCKQVKPSLSFVAVLKRNVVSNYVNVHSSVKRSDNRVQQPKVQGSTETL